MFFSGTGVQISAITRVDFRNVGTGKLGESTIVLRKMFNDIVLGRSAKFRHWCHPIYAAAPDVRSSKPAALSVK
jgi:branched-chain amino acid aminotransferase